MRIDQVGERLGIGGLANMPKHAGVNEGAGLRLLPTSSHVPRQAHIAAGLTVRQAAIREKVGKTALYSALDRRTSASECRVPICSPLAHIKVFG